MPNEEEITVQQLIDELMKIEDKSLVVKVYYDGTLEDLQIGLVNTKDHTYTISGTS